MSAWTELDGRLLVVYDGRCGFCNGSVRWLARRDRRDRLRFLPAEDARAAALLNRHGMGAVQFALQPSTLLVLRVAYGEVGQVLTHSDAVAAALAELGVPWPAVAVLLRGVPRPVRDLGYRAVARMRYRLGGRLAACPAPDATERAKFL